MKWIGQHIYGFVSRFRNEAIFEHYSHNTVGDSNRTTVINGDEIKLANSSNTSGPLIDIRNTADNNTGATVDYYNLRANPADNDKILLSRYIANNDNGDAYIVGQQLWKFADVSDGAEEGFYGLSLAAHGSAGIYNFFEAEAKGSNDIDVKIALGSSSTTTIRGELKVDGGTFNFDDVGITAIQTSAESFADNDTSLMTSAAIEDRFASVGTSVDLTSEVTGTLPVANGGTGATSLTDNKLLTGTGTSAVTAEANATYDGTDLTLTSGTSAKPELTIQNSNTDAVGSILKFEKTATGANNDKIGKIQFQADDNADSSITFAEIEGSMPSANAAGSAQIGQLQFQVRQAGSLANVLKANTIGFGTHLEFADGGLMPYITFKAAIVNFESATSTAPIFSIENQTDDANGPQLMFIKNRTTNPGSSDGDECGRITFRGYDSGNTSTDYAEFYGSAVETDASNECGKAQLLVMADGQSTLRNAITGTGHTTVDKVDIDLGYGAASTTTIAGDLQVAGGDILGPTDGDLNIKSDGGIFLTLDTDNDESNQYFTIDDIAGSNNMVFDPARGSLSIESTITNYPAISFTNKTDDAAGSQFILLKQRDDSGTQAGEDDDVIGGHLYKSYNDAGTPENITYAYTHAAIKDASDSDEAGKYTIQVATSNGTTSNLRNALYAEGSPSADDVDVTVGHGSTSIVTVGGNLSVGTEATIPSRKFTATSSTHFEYQGDVLYYGGGSTTQGDLCYLKENGEWGQADSDGAASGDDVNRDAMGMLAIALGSDPDVDGMLLRGIITMDYDLGDVGNPIYVDPAPGYMSHNAPTSSGQFVRVVGYCLDDYNGQIYFNPDNTWVEIA